MRSMVSACANVIMCWQGSFEPERAFHHRLVIVAKQGSLFRSTPKAALKPTSLKFKSFQR